MSHSYADTSRQHFEPTPIPSGWKSGSEEAALHRPNLCNDFPVPTFASFLTERLSTNDLCFDLFQQAINPHRCPRLAWVKQSSRGLGLAVDTITAHPEWTGIEARTNPCHGGPSVTLLAYPASARVRDPSPRAGSEVYESRPAGYTKTYCVPTCVNALLFLHSAASDDVLEQWRNLNPIPGCLRVKFFTSGCRCLQVPCTLVLAPLTIKRHHRANDNRDRLHGPPCPSDFSVPHPTKIQAPRLPTH